MTTLMEKLAAYGADMQGAMGRFLDDEALYEECFQMLLDDPAFQALDQALAEKNYAAAFDAAHTIKGVTGNLGLTPLYKPVCDLVESLRNSELQQLPDQYQAVLAAKSALDQL